MCTVCVYGVAVRNTGDGIFFFLICLQRKSTQEAQTSLNVIFLMFEDFHCFANCISFLLLHNNLPSKPRGLK